MAGNASVLIVSASAGSGHVRAGEALQQAFQQHHPDVRVDHVDILRLTRRWVRAAYGDGFELVASRAPWLWREIYRRTDGPAGHTARWGRVAERMLFRAFHRLLVRGDWQLCLSTHFLPTQLAAGAPGTPPFALVVTDFTLHRYWAQRRVRRYFVPTDAMAAELRRRIAGANVDVLGIPVSPIFSRTPAPEAARAKLGLDRHRPVLLVMGGAFGLGVEQNALAALRADLDAQVIAISGRNEAVRARLAARNIPRRRLAVHGYVRGIDTYLAAADLVLTKPGGLTTSEALAVGRPLLLACAMPGHEEGNARALQAAGAAVSVRTPAAVTEAVRRIFSDPAERSRLTRAARQLGRPHAARDIAAAASHEYLLDATA